MNNGKNITKPLKLRVEDPETSVVTRYAKTSYFEEKDRKAVEFLKKHPIPAKFLK